MRKSIDPMSDSDKSWERQLGSPPQCSSAAMSFQSAIPWQVALRQSLPPLHRLVTILNNPLCRTMIFQRTATTPLTSCLSPRVHSKLPHPPPTTTDLGLTLGQGPPARGAARGSAGKGDAGTRERAREGSESRKASD